MQLRLARHTDRLEAVVAFYRDGLELKHLGGFEDHDGYSGHFLGVGETDTDLEFTTGGAHTAPQPHPESLVVLYLGDKDEVRRLLKRSGAASVASANPYWDERGATTVLDPDGCRVVRVAGHLERLTVNAWQRRKIDQVNARLPNAALGPLWGPAPTDFARGGEAVTRVGACGLRYVARPHERAFLRREDWEDEPERRPIIEIIREDLANSRRRSKSRPRAWERRRLKRKANSLR